MRTKMTIGILFLFCGMPADGQPDLATIEKALLDAFDYSIQTESDHLQAKVIELEALGSDDPARAHTYSITIEFILSLFIHQVHFLLDLNFQSNYQKYLFPFFPNG